MSELNIITKIIIIIISAVAAARIIYLNCRHSRPLTTRTFGSNIRETGPIVYYAEDNHHSSDKLYKFNYKKVGTSWRAYIVRMPSLRGRDSSAHITHRLRDGDKYYVCWNRPVYSLKDIQTISRVWANNIQEYIATGRRFG